MASKGYQEFLDGVLLFRGLRDMDDFPETWAERWLSRIVISDDPQGMKDFLSLATKMAELIDDRKAWLLEEVDSDLKEAWIDMPEAA